MEVANFVKEFAIICFRMTGLAIGRRISCDAAIEGHSSSQVSTGREIAFVIDLADQFFQNVF
jgi:hypothetical protein